MADKWIQLMSEDGTDNLFPVSKMDLLWTNSSPSSAFVDQTVSIDLSDYSYILIVSQATNGITNYHSDIVSVNGTKQTFGSYYGGYYRFATPTNAGITFEFVTNNGYTIPYQVYGIR